MSRPITAFVMAAAFAVAFVVAGCATGGLPASPSPGAPGDPMPGGTQVAPAPPTADTAATPVAPSPGETAVGSSPTGIPDPDAGVTEPPEAALELLGAADAAGAPGTLLGWTWNGTGSDAPWIVPAEAVAAPLGSPLGVALAPALSPESWVARWAAVEAGGPGDVRGSAEGTGRIAFAAPNGVGVWALLVDARFGDGRSAAWAWQVVVR